MARIAALFVAALMVSVSWGVKLKHHSLTVYENGTTFKQSIDIDVKNRVIYMHVPAHRDISDCRFMYEYSTGRLLKCFRSLKRKRCLLSNFDTKSLPDPAEEEMDVKAFSRLHISPRREAGLSETSMQNTVISGKIKDLSTISQAMRKVVGDYALYREEPLPKGAKILNGNLANAALAKGQVKRSCSWWRSPVERYVTTVKDCNYVVVCGDMNRRDTCHTKHYLSGVTFRCKCCPHENSPPDCSHGCQKL